MLFLFIFEYFSCFWKSRPRWSRAWQGAETWWHLSPGKETAPGWVQARLGAARHAAPCLDIGRSLYCLPGAAFSLFFSHSICGEVSNRRCLQDWMLYLFHFIF